jgi:hypothetical protein
MERILVPWSWMWWDVMVMVKSARYCTLAWLSMRAVPLVVFQHGHLGQPACPLYTLPHIKVMLYTPGVFCTRLSFTERRKLVIFLGDRPKRLVFCPVSSLLNGGRSSGHGTGRRPWQFLTGLSSTHSWIKSTLCLLLADPLYQKMDFRTHLFFQNVGNWLPSDTGPYPTRMESSITLLTCFIHIHCLVN